MTCMVRSRIVYSLRVSHFGRTLSVDGACLSLATFVMPTPVKTILELFRPAVTRSSQRLASPGFGARRGTKLRENNLRVTQKYYEIHAINKAIDL